MVGRKVKMKRLENPTTRQVTFSEGSGSLLKKAHDLAVLCDAEVGVIMFSSKGKLSQFATPSMRSVLERYRRNCAGLEAPQNSGSSSIPVASNRPSSLLTGEQSDVVGDDLDHLSLRELMHLEYQIEGSLGCIHTKKEELLLKQLEDVKQEVTESQRIINANVSILKMLDFGGGQGGPDLTKGT